MTNSEKVRNFSQLVAKSRGVALPNSAIPLSAETAEFAVKMVIDELIELLAYSGVNVKNRYIILFNILFKANLREDLKFDEPNVEGQMDSIVDIEYYLKDISARHGQNTDRVFDLVHEANMRKVNDKGLFDLRPDGKVLKPKGWKPADISSEVKRQIEGNSFEDNSHC